MQITALNMALLSLRLQLGSVHKGRPPKEGGRGSRLSGQNVLGGLPLWTVVPAGVNLQICYLIVTRGTLILHCYSQRDATFDM